MDSGWIKIYRKIENSRSYSRGVEYLGAMVWLVLNARHEDGWSDGKLVKRGQLFVGRKQLAEAWKVSEQTVRTILDVLEEDSFLTKQSTNRGTLVTVCKYDIYQVDESPANQQINQQATNGFFEINQPATNREIKSTGYTSIEYNSENITANQQINQQVTTNKNIINNTSIPPGARAREIPDHSDRSCENRGECRTSHDNPASGILPCQAWPGGVANGRRPPDSQYSARYRLFPVTLEPGGGGQGEGGQPRPAPAATDADQRAGCQV